MSKEGRILENTSGEILSLILLAQALALDAFSICLGIGMQRLRLKRILLISLVIGSFHVFMPFIGMILGKMIASPLESYAQLVSGIILFVIGAQMFFGAFTEEKKLLIPPVGLGLFLLAITVSIDSFTVGFGLGISGVQIMLALLLFGFFSALLSCLALLIGRKVQGFLGRYSELLGGSILCGFGLSIIFIAG